MQLLFKLVDVKLDGGYSTVEAGLSDGGNEEGAWCTDSGEVDLGNGGDDGGDEKGAPVRFALVVTNTEAEPAYACKPAAPYAFPLPDGAIHVPNIPSNCISHPPSLFITILSNK